MAQALICLDSNILICAEGINDPERATLAQACLENLPSDRTAIPVQALGELSRVLVKKAAYAAPIASEIVRQYEEFATALPTTTTAFHEALILASSHNLQIWDAIILAVSAENSCKCLLSEDMQDSFVWRGVEIINPLTATGAARLRAFI